MSVRLGNPGRTNQQAPAFCYRSDIDTYSVQEVEAHSQTSQDSIDPCWDGPHIIKVPAKGEKTRIMLFSW